MKLFLISEKYYLKADSKNNSKKTITTDGKNASFPQRTIVTKI